MHIILLFGPGPAAHTQMTRTEVARDIKHEWGGRAGKQCKMDAQIGMYWWKTRWVKKMEHRIFEYAASSPTRLDPRTTDIMVNIPYNLHNCCSISPEDRAAEHIFFLLKDGGASL